VRWKFEPPDHHIQALLREDLGAPNTSSDVLIRSVADYLRGSKTTPPEVRYAHTLFSDKWQREVIEAFLLAGASPTVINDVLGIPTEVTDVYSRVYFDIDVFRNRLDVEAYARRYPEFHDDGFGKQLKCAAVDLGLNYLCATYGKGSYKLPHVDILEDVISQSFVFSKIAYTSQRTGAAAKEARQWSANLVNTIRALPEIRDSIRGDVNELRIKLKLVQDKPTSAEVDPADLICTPEE
jgi:hypothetical protein